MLSGFYDSVLSWANDAIAALGGKITPDAEAEIRRQAQASLAKAGGTAADQAQVQQDISSALKQYGGSSLPEYGGSPGDWMLPNLSQNLQDLMKIFGILAGIGLVVWIVTD